MALAVDVQSETRPAPYVTAETRRELHQEQIKLSREPSLTKVPADITRSERFIFRSLPGHYRQVQHMVDGPPKGVGDEKRDKFDRSRWEKRVLGRGYKTVQAAEAYYNDLIDRIGGTVITFQRVPKRVECYFATNDEVIAAYLRGLCARNVGEFQHVVEENGTARVVVGLNTEHEKAFPNTALGKTAAFAYAGERGLSDLTIVTE